MTGRVLGWMARHLTPGRFKKQLVDAEHDLEVAIEDLDQVAKLDTQVDRIVAAHRLDLKENHYAARVKAAYAGKEHE